MRSRSGHHRLAAGAPGDAGGVGLAAEGEIAAEVSSFAEELIRVGPMPPKAAVDAVHVAASVVHRVDYLLTWNCTHLANAAIRVKIDQMCTSRDYRPVVICTPEELMEA
jgi:hypothetical protein